MSETLTPVIYQLKIVLVGISPMIWRLIKVIRAEQVMLVDFYSSLTSLCLCKIYV